jgi:hypothetical protein
MDPGNQGIQMGLAPVTIIPGDLLAKFFFLFPQLYALLAQNYSFQKEKCFYQKTQ